MRGSTHLCILFPSSLLGSLSPLGLLQDGHDMKTSVFFFCFFFFSQKILKGWESSLSDFSCVFSFFFPELLLLFCDPHSSAAGIHIATLSAGREHWTWEQTGEVKKQVLRESVCSAPHSFLCCIWGIFQTVPYFTFIFHLNVSLNCDQWLKKKKKKKRGDWLWGNFTMC